MLKALNHTRIFERPGARHAHTNETAIRQQSTDARLVAACSVLGSQFLASLTGLIPERYSAQWTVMLMVATALVLAFLLRRPVRRRALRRFSRIGVAMSPRPRSGAREGHWFLDAEALERSTAALNRNAEAIERHSRALEHHSTRSK